MNIIEKTQLQSDIENLEKRISKTLSALEFTVSQLNLAYDSVWKLPDERLQALLQTLVDSGKFEEIFSVHAKSASYINELIEVAGGKARAYTGAGREYTIEDGIVTVTPLLKPEPVIEEIVE